MKSPGTRRHVALLRGINVGKAKRISMVDLRALFEDLGLVDVRSLLNSGNVVFTYARRSTANPSGRIAAAIERAFGIRANVLVLDAREFFSIVVENPLGDVATNGSRLLVNVLQDPADRTKLTKLTKMDWGEDAFAVGSRAAYLWCSGGVLASELPAAVSEALGDATTARNWNTVQKIAAALAES